MLFEKAIPLLTQRLFNDGVKYATNSWSESLLIEYFAGKNPKGEVGQLVGEFIRDNLVEPPTSISFRLNIVSYTLGYLIRDLVYMERFPQDAHIYKAHAKLSFANALIQWKLLCEQLGLVWGEELALGEEHLRERYKDFEQDGWVSK